jgi:hypothetical protein
MPKALIPVDSRNTTLGMSCIAYANACRTVRSAGRELELLMNNMRITGTTPDFTLLESQAGLTVGDGNNLLTAISNANIDIEASTAFKNVCEKIYPKV